MYIRTNICIYVRSKHFNEYWAILEKLRRYGIAIKYLGMMVLSLLLNFSNILLIYSYFCTSVHQYSH